MRTYLAESETRARAQRDCVENAGFYPYHLAKVNGGYMCFESVEDFKTYRKQR